MTRQAVLDLCSALTLGQLSADTFAQYYDDAIYALGSVPYLVQPYQVPVDLQQGRFDYPDGAIELLDLWYDARHLDQMAQPQLDAMHPNWQDHRGYPVAYTTDSLDLLAFQVYPVPDMPSAPPLFPQSLQWGEHYPLYHVSMLATAHQVDLPVWMELPIAYQLLAREYGRESPHRDPVYAAACQQVSALLMDMLKLPDIE